MVVAGALAGTIGEGLFEQRFQSGPGYQHGARPSLIVCAVTFVAFLAAIVNASLVSAGRVTLNLAIPDPLQPWLRAGLAIAFGVLIGTTIFV